MLETKEHKDAFNQYYLMGADRSLRELARLRNVSEKTPKRWSKAHNWQERIELKDIDLSRKTEEALDDAVVNTRADYRKMIKENMAEDVKLDSYVTTLIGKAKDKIEKGELSVDNIKDLVELMRVKQGSTAKKVELMKADLLMMGEADSRVDNTVRINVHGVDMGQFPEPFKIEGDEEDES
jgi:hypothetical protein